MMKKYLRAIALLFTVTITLISCANATNVAQTAENNIQIKATDVITDDGSFDYSDYAAVLKTYVNNAGLVDYQGLQANRQQLDRFNQSLAAVTPEIYQAWSEPEQIAFWMNAYNSLTLQSIIARDPLEKSIRDIPGVWKRRKFEIAGQAKTLDNIEHDTLRQDFDEPRLHVALVCAAMSCPPLRNEPYLAEQLDSQLDDQVERFITSSRGFRLNRSEGKVALSSIFKWYGRDWEASYGVKERFAGNGKERAVLNFISQYLEAKDRQYLEQGNYKVSYINYDWSLNRQ